MTRDVAELRQAVEELQETVRKQGEAIEELQKVNSWGTWARNQKRETGAP